MQSKAKTVGEYLAELPPERRAVVEAVRDVLRANLPKGIEEGMQYGHIGYYVPHSLFPAGYHCDPKQPLPFAGLGAQKNHIGLYLFCLYTTPSEVEAFTKAWRATGKKLDMGASCVRFKKLGDVPLDVVAATMRRMTTADFIAQYEAARDASRPASAKRAKAAPAAKAPARKAASAKAAAPKAPTQAGTKKAPTKKAPAKSAPAKKGAAKKAPTRR